MHSNCEALLSAKIFRSLFYLGGRFGIASIGFDRVSALRARLRDQKDRHECNPSSEAKVSYRDPYELHWVHLAAFSARLHPVNLLMDAGPVNPDLTIHVVTENPAEPL